MSVINTRSFGRFWPFHGLLLTDFGSMSDFHVYRTPGCVYVSFINSPRFVHFCVLSWTITHRFRVQRDFHGCRTPRCAYVLIIKTRSLRRFFPVSWTITQVWGPEVISTIDEPPVTFTCRSSTLKILAYSGSFRALLHTSLGSQSDFQD